MGTVFCNGKDVRGTSLHHFHQNLNIMSIYPQTRTRGYDLTEVFSAEGPPAPEVLCKYLDFEDRIEVPSDTFTIVMNRDIRKPVEIANIMAVHIARQFPEQSVLLVNTYAGTDLMQRSLAVAFAQGDVKLPPSFAPYLDARWQDSIAEDAPTPFPPNLRVLDAATGTLDAWHIEEELKLMDPTLERRATVILNSFECSVWGYWRDRKAFAEQLVELRERRRLTFVLFSHEIRADVQNHTPAHGGIGIISAFAGSVWYLMRQSDRAKFNAYYKRIASLTVVKEPKVVVIKEDRPEEPYIDSFSTRAAELHEK